MTRSRWAREFYDRHVADHHSHNAALRAFGNRWLEVLWHCLSRGVRYDEAVHIASDLVEAADLPPAGPDRRELEELVWARLAEGAPTLALSELAAKLGFAPIKSS